MCCARGCIELTLLVVFGLLLDGAHVADERDFRFIDGAEVGDVAFCSNRNSTSSSSPLI